MEELLTFLFFIVWIIFGSLGSKKKREEAQERAQIERAEREARARARRAAREASDEEGRIHAPMEPARQPPGGMAETGTALDMVPDELWAILTGGAPRPTGTGGPTGPTAHVPTRVPDEAPYEDEWQSAGPDDGGWVTSPPWTEEDAVHSIEGVSAEQTGENVLDYDDFAEQAARARYENVRATSWDDQPTSRDALALRMSETSDRRHHEFHDSLRASEIGAAQVERPSNGMRLGLHDLGEVRRAIVLAEILGPPKALQD